MNKCLLRVGVTLLLGSLLPAVSGCSHNPNHDIDMERAREAANRVHSPPKLSPSEQAKATEDRGG